MFEERALCTRTKGLSIFIDTLIVKADILNNLDNERKFSVSRYSTR